MELGLFDKLWDTSYAITGFAVAQALIYLYATEKESIAAQIRTRWRGVSVAIIVFHALYIYAIGWCHTTMAEVAKTELKNAAYSDILHGIGLGQQGFIALLGGFALYITILNRQSKSAT